MTEPAKKWTIKELLNWISTYLAQKEIDSPRLCAELLLANVLEMSRIQLYTNFDKTVSEPDREKLRSLVKHAADQEPVQYLVGRTEFYSLEIELTRDTLIPRPETELLVERAIEYLRTKNGPQLICDLCTGSGCIAVAIAKNFADCHIIATDISDQALNVAAANIKKHHLESRIDLINGNLFEPLIGQMNENLFDLIVTNPPYVSESEYQNLPENIRKHEPTHALLAGPEGLDIYKQIAVQAPNHLKPGAAIMMEIGYKQAPAVNELLEKANLKNISVEKDHAGRDRLVKAFK